MKTTRTKRIIAAILCVCTLMFSTAAFSSCNKGKEAPKEEAITVLQFIENVDAGKKILKSDVQEVSVFPSDVPSGTLELTLDDIENKPYYTGMMVFAGDFLTDQRAVNKKIDTNDNVNNNAQDTDDYVIATPLKGDCSEELQKLIDDNPNKTIYFPDGTYNISKPLIIPTSRDKRVSLRLSHYAVISVLNHEMWTKNDPVIHFGAGEPTAADVNDAVDIKAYITGGTIDGKRMATAIKIEGEGNVTVHHMALKNFSIGVHIASNNVYVDSITGTGNSTTSSIGVLIEGSHNTVSTLRMCQIHYGIKLTKGQNVLRNLHPLISTMKDSSTSIGFWDLSEGNFYDYCYSDQFAMAFKLADGNSSVFNGCHSYWWSPDNRIHYGFYVDGKFDGVINTCRIVMCHPNEVDNAFIVVKTDGGDGKIINPMVSVLDDANIQDDHAKDLNKYTIE